MNSKRIRNGFIYFLLVAAVGVFLYSTLTQEKTTNSEAFALDGVANAVRKGEVKELRIDNDIVTVVFNDDTRRESRKEEDSSLVTTLLN